MGWGTCIRKWDSQTGQTFQVPTLDCFFVVFTLFVDFAFLIAGIVAVIMIIIAGFRFMFSGGDAKQIGEAQKTLTYAIVGLIVILLSFTVLKLIVLITGVSCINLLRFTGCTI